MSATYVPGDRVAIAAQECWLLVDLQPEHELVARCWSLLSAGAGVDDVLDALVSRGLRTAPTFALVRRSAGERRAVVRGDARVVVDNGTTIAAPSRGWVDEDLPDHAALTLISGHPSQSYALPMAFGVTMATSITVAADGDHPAESTSAPPTSAEPTAAPPAAVVEPPVEASPSEETTDFTPFAFGQTERIERAPQTGVTEPVDPLVAMNPNSEAPPSGPTPGVIDSLPWLSPAPGEATVDRAALHRSLGTSPDHRAGPVPIAGPSVVAGYCPSGHLSPPHVPVCRVCGLDMPPQTGFEIARPPLGILRLSTGDDVILDRGVLFGRAPEIPEGVVERPNAVKLASPDNDISRTHAAVTVEGWFVHVTDLGSTNGTTVTLPGQQPVRLRPHDAQLLEAGALVSLADEVSFTFEVSS